MCITLSCPEACRIPSFTLHKSTLYTIEARLRARGVTACAREVVVHDLSNRLVPYSEGWALQKSLVASLVASSSSAAGPAGHLVLLQHQPVYTLGSGSSLQHLGFDPEDSPHPLHRTERGGEVTYHGPGQLVAYPILDLHAFQMDLHWYLRSLEEVIIRALEEVSGLRGEREPGLTGVWVRGAKVAAIGVRVRRWVTYHGLALNVCPDLAPFARITPCGIAGRPVTSVKELLQVDDAGAGDMIRTMHTVQKALCLSADAEPGVAGQGAMQMREYVHALELAFADVFGVNLARRQAVFSSSMLRRI